MTTWKAIIAAIFIAMPISVMAQSRLVVVELYTSQGCSSCPPADALLHRLTKRDDVLPLALHVDYWDYIGWKDQFADPAHTVRQKGYASVAGRNMIYTPQMIIMGQEDVVGADAMELADVIARHQQRPAVIDVDTHRTKAELQIALSPLQDLPTENLLVQLVRFTPVKSIAISRGELAGRHFDYVNVVEDMQQVGIWDGQQETVITVPVQGPQSIAILVQRGAYGAILAASRVD